MVDYSELKEKYVTLEWRTEGLTKWLEEWWNEFSYAEQEQLGGILGRSIELINVHVPEGFIDAMIHYWDFDRRVFRFASREMVPTLEEIQLITDFDLEASCVRPTGGGMKDVFRKHFMIKDEYLEHVRDKDGLMPVKELMNLYGSKKTYADVGRHFVMGQDEKTWRSLRMDAFIVGVLTRVYFPCPNGKVDPAMVVILTGLKERKTIIPTILGQMLVSLARCKVSKTKKFFEGSECILYIWMMAHMADLPPPLPQWSRDPNRKYRWRPAGVKTYEEWVKFLGELSNDRIEMNMGWNGSRFFLEGPERPFISLCGLRGIGIYYPSAVMNQFGHRQRVPTIAAAEVHKNATKTNRATWEKALNDWVKSKMGFVSVSERGYSHEYEIWVKEQKSLWKKREFYYQGEQQNTPAMSTDVSKGMPARDLKEWEKKLEDLEESILRRDSMLENRDRAIRESEEIIMKLKAELARKGEGGQEGDAEKMVQLEGLIADSNATINILKRDKMELEKRHEEDQRNIDMWEEIHEEDMELIEELGEIRDESRARINELEQKLSEKDIEGYIQRENDLNAKLEQAKKREEELETRLDESYQREEKLLNHWEASKHRVKELEKQLKDSMEEAKRLLWRIERIPKGRMDLQRMKRMVDFLIEEIEGGIALIGCSNRSLIPLAEDVEDGIRLIGRLKNVFN